MWRLQADEDDNGDGDNDVLDTHNFATAAITSVLLKQVSSGIILSHSTHITGSDSVALHDVDPPRLSF